MEQTINYYNLNAKNFIENTQNAGHAYTSKTVFHRLLAEHASILDFGLWFWSGYKVFSLERI